MITKPNYTLRYKLYAKFYREKVILINKIFFNIRTIGSFKNILSKLRRKSNFLTSIEDIPVCNTLKNNQRICRKANHKIADILAEHLFSHLISIKYVKLLTL